MKTAFTQYHSEQQKIAKKQNITLRQLYEKLQPFAKKCVMDGSYESGDATAALVQILAEEDAEHFFINDKNFFKWLVGAFPKDNLNNALDAFGEITTRTGVVFHFPTAWGIPSFLLSVFRVEIPAVGERGDAATKLVSISASCDARGYGYVLLNNTAASLDFIERQDDKMKEIIKLAISTMLYASCFPEYVKNGPPEELKHPSHHKYKNIKLISPSPKINNCHGSPSAHFRSGHFRVLRSEKFTHKRFQVIFISQTFVKGIASTVLSPEQQS